MCAVVASLAQLLIDPYFRSLNGFQSLIQKEWVAMGHPFCTRLSHVYNIETQEVSLLYCMYRFSLKWQMIYVTIIWPLIISSKNQSQLSTLKI